MNKFRLNSDLDEMKIPKKFFSEKTGKKFKNCMLCEKKLLKNGTNYMIEKAFKNNKYTGEKKLIIEYAICLDCQQNMTVEFSKESMRNINMYLRLYINEDEEIINAKKIMKKRLKKCFVTQEKISESSEYQIAGYFVENKMILLAGLPLAIGEKAINDLQELISEKTQNSIDDFKDLITPPGVEETVPDGKFVLI